jgi:signal peptidase II
MFGRGVLIAVLVAALDQFTKWLILTKVMVPPHPVTVTFFFDLVLNWNPGISFGLFAGHPEMGSWLFVAVAAGITLTLLIWLGRVDRALLAIAISFVIGGAVGNIIDRLRFGAVVDFLYFHLGQYDFPAFNLADSAITVGVGLLLIDSLFGEGRSRK